MFQSSYHLLEERTMKATKSWQLDRVQPAVPGAGVPGQRMQPQEAHSRKHRSLPTRASRNDDGAHRRSRPPNPRPSPLRSRHAPSPRQSRRQNRRPNRHRRATPEPTKEPAPEPHARNRRLNPHRNRHPRPRRNQRLSPRRRWPPAPTASPPAEPAVPAPASRPRRAAPAAFEL